MKIFTGPLYFSRSCDCFGLSIVNGEHIDSTKSYSWEPEERRKVGMGLHGRSVCWPLGRATSLFFLGPDVSFTAIDLEWLAEQKAEYL